MGGLTLRKLGGEVGGAYYSAVAMAIRRLQTRFRRNRPLRQAMRTVVNQCAK
jgi:hypothetical protein